ncbi:MAG: NAD(P)/FAD-dependent oxidoreductase [Bryobacterales bacterium]|nr:NAD(P)/FAD-dependent oxidoreductase [Bryobacterales bacterium]
MPDVVVVGAGPAGIAAARAVRECGKTVAVLDDNFAAGGQIWRGEPVSLEGLRAGTRVLGPWQLGSERIVLATGARELFLPFPGWTLPNVVGAGGLQALVKGGLAVRGKRIIVAGSGPLLLVVALYLQKQGAQVLFVAEQASTRQMMALARHPLKLVEGLRLRAGLLGVPYRTECWPVSAEGPGQLLSVTLRQRGETWTERCDYLACGFGLVPNAELAALFGCELRDGFVVVDEKQRTSIPNVFAAGEITGIGGVEKASEEGRVAGLTAAGRDARCSRQVFPDTLRRAFALRDELRHLATRDTIVCRCEDVPLAAIRPAASWRESKLQTRCGMGPCQGRVCGPALQFLCGWRDESVRPPLYPAPVEELLSEKLLDE